MKNHVMTAMIVFTTITSAMAQYGNQQYGNQQYGNQSYANNDDRYYYDNDFDWHWDIRVKISNGIQQGLITPNESNRLYRRLEDLERKEYVYQSDGIFNSWEQQEIWDDVVYLNRQVGIELYDNDRTFYGFDVYGYDRRGYSKWYYQGGYDFFRFDKRGYGSIQLGYAPRPNYYGWYRNNDNRIARSYYKERSRYDVRGGNRWENERREYGDRDNRGYGNQLGRYSNGGGYGNRNGQVYGGNNGQYPQGTGGNRPNVVPSHPNNNDGYQGNGGGGNPSGGQQGGNRQGGGYSQGNGGGSPSGGQQGGNRQEGGYSQGNGGGSPSLPSNRSESPRGGGGGEERRGGDRRRGGE